MSIDKKSITIREKKKSTWKIVFITLLIANAIYLVPFLFTLIFYDTSIGWGVWGAILWIPYLFVFWIINFIAVFAYVITHHLRGTARLVSDAVLIVMGFIPIVLGILSYVMLCTFERCSSETLPELLEELFRLW